MATRPAPAVDKALRFLDELVVHRGEELTITDLARRTGTSLGSAHAVLAVLERAGYLTRHPTRKTYRLGPALVSAGRAAFEEHPAIRAAADQIPALAAELGADVVVTAATPAEIVFVAVDGKGSRYGRGFREGERVPLMPPLGLVFMAWAHPREVAAWLERAPAVADPEWAGHAVATVRGRGFALGSTSGTREALAGPVLEWAGYDLPVVEPGRTYELGMASAPVFDVDGRVVAAITASGFPPGLAGQEVLGIGERVRSCATIVTKQTRGRFPA
jgi:DNA-binding IclR family transcriptional regulator